jgi:hypothetical protein
MLTIGERGSKMTNIEGSPEDSVEAFARLYVALEAPSADRRALLVAAGLDEEGFARLRQRWAERFTADMDGAGARFGEACAAARDGQDAGD